MHPPLGWFLTLRRIGIKLGLIKKPLFSKEQFEEYRRQYALSRKVLLLGASIPRTMLRALGNHDERFIAFDVLLDQLMTQKIANEDELAEVITEAGIQLMFVANRPIARTLGAKTRYLSSDMMDKIEAIDTMISDQVKKDDTLSGHAITLLLHRR